MLKIYTGNINDIKKEMNKLVSKYNLSKIKFSKNILNEKFYGFFYEPSLFYFFYSKEFFKDKETIQRFIEFCENTDSLIICISEEPLDKKTIQYKNLKSYIVELTIQNKTNKKSENLDDIYNIENKDFISVLFSLSYSKYRQAAGFVLNLILTGRLNNIDIAKKLFLVLATMR